MFKCEGGEESVDFFFEDQEKHGRVSFVNMNE